MNSYTRYLTAIVCNILYTTYINRRLYSGGAPAMNFAALRSDTE